MPNLTGTSGDDVLTGGSGDDSLEDRLGGADILRGEAGNDRLIVSRSLGTAIAPIRLEGGDGDDYISFQLYNGSSVSVDGGAGSDRILLIGAAGGATITTGSGSDVLEMYDSYTTTLGTVNTVTVTDFTTGAGGDRLDWSAYLGRTLTGWGGGNPFASGHVRLIQSGTDSLLQIDRDGGANGFQTLFIFQNTNASSFTTENLGGFPADGSTPAGQTINGTSASEILTGSGGSDTINGFGGTDTIYGGAGDDVINGDDGDDYLYGGIGSDISYGGNGADTLEDRDNGADILRGEAGNDRLIVSRSLGTAIAPIRLEGGDGDDYISFQLYNGSSVSVDGGAGSDRILLIGAAGGATITTGSGSDVLEMYDSYTTTLGTVNTVTVTDFTTGAGGDRLDWSAYLGRTLTGWGGGNPFASGHVRLIQSGTDSLLQIDRDGGANGFQTLFIFQNTNASSFTTENLGGFEAVAGPITARVNAPTVLTEGGNAGLSVTFLNATQFSSTITVRLVATSSVTGEDVSLPLGTYAINVNQLPARDYVYSLGGINALDDLDIEGLENIVLEVTATGQNFGPTGDVTSVTIGLIDNDLRGGSGADTLNGDDGLNRLEGMDGNDTIIGRGGADILDGGYGDDALDGGTSNDTLTGGAGADTLTGGAGADTFRYLAASDSTATASDTITDFVAGVDRIDLTALNPTSVSIARLVGGGTVVFAETAGGAFQTFVAGANLNGGDFVFNGGFGVFVIGSDAADVILGSAIADPLVGNGGDDVITGGGGADAISGGAGRDVFRYVSRADSNQTTGFDNLYDFTTGEDRIDLTAMAPTSISILRTDNGSSFIYAETRDGVFLTTAANRTVQATDITFGTGPNGVGGFGIYMVGSGVADVLVGTSLADPISGGGGNDFITGGGGADALFGDAGADTFIYLAASDSTQAASDGIFGFVSGQDRLDLRAVRTGAADTFGIAYLSGGSYLFVDLGGNGTSDLVIGLAGTTLLASDILWTPAGLLDETVGKDVGPSVLPWLDGDQAGGVDADAFDLSGFAPRTGNVMEWAPDSSPATFHGHDWYL